MAANLFAAWRGLGPLERRFLRTQQVQAEYPADLWLVFVDRLAAFDQRCDAARRWARNLAIASGIVVPAVLLLTPVIADHIDVSALSLHAVATRAAIGCAVVCVLSLAGWFSLRRVDIPNALREFVAPMVRLLREDMKPGTPLALSLDMRGPTLTGKQTRSETSGGSRPARTDVYFEDPWFQGSARLADGARLHLRIADRVRKRSMRKTNPRGKVKRKTKYKTKRNTRVALGVRKGRYREGAGGDAVSVKHKDTRTEVRFSRLAVWRERPGVETPPEIEPVIDLIATAYRSLESSPARRG